MTPYILPYHMKSAGARALKEKLGCKLLLRRNSKFKPLPGRKVINWGFHGEHPAFDGEVVNKPEAVRVASDKLKTFRALDKAGVRIPKWTTRSEIATEGDLGRRFIARHILNGHSGKGIEVVDLDTDDNDGFLDAPLFTELLPKDREYRVHVWGDEVLDVRYKGIPRGTEAKDTVVRNWGNGYRFIKNFNHEPTPDIFTQSLAAVKALGLDFGAVDVCTVGANAYVLEVNTAPGIEGSTVDHYARKIMGV